MAEKLSKAAVLEALRGILVPGNESGEDIVSGKRVSGLSIQDSEKGADVRFILSADLAMGGSADSMRSAAENAVSKIPGVKSVAAVLVAHKAAPAPKTEPPKPGAPVLGHGAQERPFIDAHHILHVIAVGSGKGGVGKSTTAVNLAVALALDGKKVGLLDADVHGPSIPRLLGLSGKPESNGDGKLMPFEKHGIRAMSVGLLVDERAPLIWRGPMVHGAIKQLFQDVEWGDLDVLIVDMPPGTGDAALTLIQNAHLSGAVVISTPQDVALADVRKSIGLFQKAHVPILGLVENMGPFVCPHCGKPTDIFSAGGAEAEAKLLGIPFLGTIALDRTLRETSDAGTPLVAAQPQHPHSHAYRRMASGLWLSLGETPR